MTKPTEDNPPPHQGGQLTVEPNIRDVPHAPVLFFDGAPTSGNINGTVSVTLVAGRQLGHVGGTKMDFVAVGFLRCSIAGAIELRNALDNALALASAPPAPSPPDKKSLN